MFVVRPIVASVCRTAVQNPSDPYASGYIPADFVLLIANTASFSAGFRADLLANSKRIAYRIDLAQTIRDAAGTDGTEGNTSTPGLSGATSASSNVIVVSEAGASTASSSGTGTEEDPYIIENKDWSGAGAARCFYWNHAAATYYIELRNCILAEATSQDLEVYCASGLTLRNCKLYNTTSNAYVCLENSLNTGYINFIDCLFAGDNATQTFGFRASTAKSFTNCKMDESEQAKTGKVFNPVDTNTGALTMTNCDFRVSTASGAGVFLDYASNVLGTVTITDCVFGGFSSFLAQATINTEEITNMSITNSSFTDFTAEIIKTNWITDSTFTHCYFGHETVGAGTRVVQFLHDSTRSGKGPNNVLVDGCKITKATGSNAAGDEAIESSAGIDVVFRYCWVTECPEDAFEHSMPISGCRIEYCVGDNVGNQIIDFFKQWDAGGWAEITGPNDLSSAPDTECYAHHIYGDCAAEVGEFKGIRGLVVHDLYADNSAGVSATINLAVSSDGVEPRNVFIAGPMPLNAQSGATPQVDFNGTVNNCEANWIDEDGFLQTVTS